MRRIFVLGLTLAIMSVSVARADNRAVIDRADSDGPLDIAAAGLRHSGRDLTFELVTYEEWQSGDLNFGGLTWRINTDSDQRVERGVIVHPNEEGELEARVYGRGGEIEGFRGLGEVSRPDDHSVQVVISKRLLKSSGLSSVSWQASSTVETSGGPCDGEAGGCSDYVPSRSRFIEHDL
jgi:hypothetical protein